MKFSWGESALAFLETRIRVTGVDLQKMLDVKEDFLRGMCKKMLADVRRECEYNTKQRQDDRRRVAELAFEIDDLNLYRHVLENALPDFRNQIQR